MSSMEPDAKSKVVQNLLNEYAIEKLVKHACEYLSVIGVSKYSVAVRNSPEDERLPVLYLVPTSVVDGDLVIKIYHNLKENGEIKARLWRRDGDSEFADTLRKEAVPLVNPVIIE
jgi:hypothetical protein